MFYYFIIILNQNSPKLPKSVSGFSRISIKRVSGVLSSSFRLPSTSANEPNAVFYTGMLCGFSIFNLQLAYCVLLETNPSLC